MLCLADNDIVIKLAECNLLDEALEVHGQTPGSVYIAPTAKFSLPAQAERLGQPKVAARIASFAAAAKPIDWELPEDEMLLFEDTLGIDQGEAVLYAATAGRESFILATGDKVSLKALARCHDCAEVVGRLAGKVVCLERCVQDCIQHCGFVEVRRRVVPARTCDKMLASVFGSGLIAELAAVSDGLNSYMSDLRKQTGNLLYVG